jgi:hypothetical protein
MATGVRTVRSRSDVGRVRGGPNGSEWVRGGSEQLRMALTGGPECVRRACAKRYPAVRGVRSESDGGDQTEETDVCRRHRSSPQR